MPRAEFLEHPHRDDLGNGAFGEDSKKLGISPPASSDYLALCAALLH